MKYKLIALALLLLLLLPLLACIPTTPIPDIVPSDIPVPISEPEPSIPVVVEEEPAKPISEKIVFASNKGTPWVNNWEIYTIDTDGSNSIRLTDDPAQDMHPRWSPDGTKIAFVSNRGSDTPTLFWHSQLYVMNGDGTNLKCLSTKGCHFCPLAWSPNGTEIAFVGGRGALYYVKISEGEEVRLTNRQVWDWQPVWTPAGDGIYYTSYTVPPRSNSPYTVPHPYLISRDGRENTKLATWPSTLEEWRWKGSLSSAGVRLVYTQVGKTWADDRICTCDLSGDSKEILAEGQSPSWQYGSQTRLTFSPFEQLGR